jgi:hypothetical protein
VDLSWLVSSKGAPAPISIFLRARSNNKSSVRACLFAVQPSCCGASDANKKSVINQTTCGSGQTIFAWSNIFWVGATYSGASGQFLGKPSVIVGFLICHSCSPPELPKHNNPATLVRTTGQPATIAARRCISSGATHILISAPGTNGKRFFVRNAMSRSSVARISRGIRTENRDIYGRDCAKY